MESFTVRGSALEGDGDGCRGGRGEGDEDDGDGLDSWLLEAR